MIIARDHLADADGLNGASVYQCASGKALIHDHQAKGLRQPL
jgi:hypothetical protein